MNATPSVSYFVKLYLSTSQSLTLEEIIILIRTRRWIHEITAYRTALASGDKEAARSLKAQLPGFTPSGLFKGGHRANQLEAYSQVVGLDFDHVADLAALIALFLRQPFTLALFISPGGEGLKVFVRVDTAREEHAAAFAAVAAHYEHLSGVFCDRACKDISRCCYVSDDPEAFYNPEAQVFSPASVVQGQVFVHDWLRAHPAVEGSRNQTVYRLGCEANRRGFDRNETASFCNINNNSLHSLFTATMCTERTVFSSFNANDISSIGDNFTITFFALSTSKDSKALISGSQSEMATVLPPCPSLLAGSRNRQSTGSISCK